MKASLAILLACCACMAKADPVSINIDFGYSIPIPDASFGAAGKSGLWNSVTELSASPTTGLLDTDGNATSFAISATDPLFTVEPVGQFFSGDDQTLLGDYVCSPYSTLTIQFTGLALGSYELIAYTVGRQDYPAASTAQLQGGPIKATTGIWQGDYAEGITHTTHGLLVGNIADTFALEIYCPNDACINGMQIVAIPEPTTTSLLVCAGSVLWLMRKKTAHRPYPTPKPPYHGHV